MLSPYQPRSQKHTPHEPHRTLTHSYDAFLNVVLEDAKEVLPSGGSTAIGQVVIRGNSITQFECLGLVDRQGDTAAA